jgi:GT2 family glycosyltransferase
MPTPEPEVSVIVLNYNGAKYVEGCLRTLLGNQYGNFEVLFVDNDSPDKSVEVAKRLYGRHPQVKIIQNPANLGFSMGNNVGFKKSKAKYVIVLNNDTQVPPDFISTLVDLAETDEKIGSVGCKILQPDKTVQYGPVFMNYGFVTHCNKRQTYDKPSVALANCGCATLFRKSLLDKIGGFDVYLWTDWEDHDLGFRINSAGYRCVYTPKTVVQHLGGGNYLGMSEERRIRILRNRLLCYYKNYEAKNLVWRFPMVVFKTLAVDGLYSFSKRKFGRVFWAFVGFLKLLEPISRERAQVQKLRAVSDAQIFRNCQIPERQSIFKTLRRM